MENTSTAAKDTQQSGFTPMNWQLWPRTFAAFSATYFRYAEFGSPGDPMRNAQYLLQGMLRYRSTWDAEHGHRNVPQTALDAAAAHEIYYQWNRSYKPQRPAAALSACLVQLAIQRPERILERAPRSKQEAGRPLAAAGQPLHR